MKLRILASMLALALLLSLCACGGTAGSDTTVSTQDGSASVVETESTGSETTVPDAEAVSDENVSASAQEPEDNEIAEEPEIEVSYPLTEEDITLDYMNQEFRQITPLMENGDWNNHLLLQAAEKITGVKINYIPVPAFDIPEYYALSFASGDLADIYYWGVYQYPTGADGAIEDDIFIRLNELIDEYAPYYKQARESNENTMRETISDEGNIVSFYVLNTESVYDGMGLMTRKDLLDKAGLDIPETYDDWYEMLTAYKNMGVEIPSYTLGDMNGVLFGGWGLDYNWISMINSPFFQIDGEVQFSPLAENFYPMLEMFHKWYAEGLVLEDFYIMHDMADSQSKENTGITATWACFANAANLFRKNSTIEGGEAVPIPNPVLNRGDQIHIGVSKSLVEDDCGAVSTGCEYPELAVQWLDFWYGPKGSELVNYGVEGIAFEYDAEGVPQFTDLILNNELGLTTEAVNGYYLGANFPGLFDPTVQLIIYDQDQIDAMEVWSSNMDDLWNYPSGAAMTAAETEEFNGYYSDIATYISTEGISFITGARALSTFDDFVETLHSMGADRCIELKQAALDRYYSKEIN